MTNIIKNVGVIGAGKMGVGIAHVCAASGFNIKLVDISDEILSEAKNTIEQNLSKLVKRGRMSEDQKQITLQNVSISSEIKTLADCDLVIEAATEDENVKKLIYDKICPILRDDTILATNSSSISITRLAAQTDRPEKFMGVHFMNPAPLMELIELINGIATEQTIFDIIHQFALELGKTPVCSEDFPAFIVNRILLPMVNEAVYTLYEGVGSVEAIDTSMKLGAHHPMGPLELADFIGLDTCLSVMQVLHDGLADTKYRPCPLLVKYVEAGWLGRKTGRGFYDYSEDKPRPTR
ncbi:MAG TPA: 3-hydroxybutyryl-CoA dehydrogenase [Rhodospirillales bacterium]|nr:3-hydroxybutyryl-CoA dehydrogenase [Rhodospirillales bacterium]|tara:strand:+ start:23 stop:904 length:882 start_codon:yes stop_codon:yes gene_type:complete